MMTSGAKRDSKAGTCERRELISPYMLSKIITTNTNIIELEAAVDNDFPIFVSGSFLSKKETTGWFESTCKSLPINIAGVVTSAVPDIKHCNAVRA